MLREALKISSPLVLVSREVPRFHGGSLWHSTPALNSERFAFLGSTYSSPTSMEFSLIGTKNLQIQRIQGI